MVERRSRRTTADVMLTLKKSESSIVRKLFTHFKETPGTHKLGVLYLIDSIVRHWEHITRQNGRPPRSAAPDGSFAGGVDRLTKLLPILMTDIVNNAPPKHQEKIKQLFDIWEYNDTFPPAMLISFRAKLSASPQDSHFSRRDNSTALSFSLSDAPAAAKEIINQHDPPIDPVQKGMSMHTFPTSLLNTALSSSTGPYHASFVDPEKVNPRTRANTRAPLNDQSASLGCFDDGNVLLQANPSPKLADDQHYDNCRRFRGNDYCEHSPSCQRCQSVSLPWNSSLIRSPLPQLVEWDFSIGSGNIKILSRTLFVNGIASESRLRSIFENFGIIQTCIINKKKRHAFIKMLSRRDALKARTEASWYDSGEAHFCTGWGVGFGPRECNDYRTGISVIPLKRLTCADRKWLLTAKYGGTGGLPLKSGMVVEEPDIEIGAGVSSKSLSRVFPATHRKYGRRTGRTRDRGIYDGGVRTNHTECTGFGRTRQAHPRHN
ncbi:hypothetical protein N7450_011596 [Penicillium hetheringtonii]|uniref:CID domain-containing protein n=1 Tax=Penicillium hetheringtonii TaxID=911720 RepID=A0AAD6DAC5_9EURO|nr:hypothetical protein N7450_011596 [Penicillium hetheringtonii]